MSEKGWEPLLLRIWPETKRKYSKKEIEQVLYMEQERENKNNTLFHTDD